MQKLTLEHETEIIATIDELNQYINGNASADQLLRVLHSTYISILKSEIAKNEKSRAQRSGGITPN